jgi:hypothetical protein
MNIPAPLTAARWRRICAHHHAQAELAHQRDGAVVPLLLLFGTAEPTLVALPDGVLAAGVTEKLAEVARQTGAQAAVLSAEAWTAHPSIPPDALARLDPADLPRPAEMRGRREGLITSGVWPGGECSVHLLSLLERGPGAVRLAPAQELEARPVGTVAWLEHLLGATGHPNRP